MQDSKNEDELFSRWQTQARKGWLEFFLLLLLTRGRSYGYEIAVQMKKFTGAELAEGTLYPLLKRLQRDGLVDAVWDTQTGGTPRKYYELTPAGRRLEQRMLREWTQWQGTVPDLNEEAE